MEKASIADLRLFIALADAIEGWVSPNAAGRMTTAAAATKLGFKGPTSAKKLIERLEEGTSTWFFERSTPLPKVARQRPRSSVPEGAALPKGAKASNVRLALTEDGKLWLKYAMAVVTLHDLAREATRVRFEPSLAGRSASKPFDKRAPSPEIPKRPSEESKARFSVWMDHHLQEILGARDFSRQSAHASVYNLNWLVPGHIRDRGEESPYPVPE